MKKKDLVEMLSSFPDDAEIMIQELSCDIVRPAIDVIQGWLIDDGSEAPHVIPDTEDPEDYGIEEPPEKVIVIE